MPVVAPATFSTSGTAATPDRWWTAFGDARLDTLVARALEGNLDLRTAWERLREARAFVDVESAAQRPILDAEARGEVQRPEDRGGESLLLGLSSTYEVDLWGRIGSRVEAEQYRARATLADYRTVAISLAAEVARTWFGLLEAHGQLDLVADQVATNETALRSLEIRFGTGQSRAVDILRQRQLVEATREQATVAAARVSVLEHRLAVLLGRAPGDSVRIGGDRLPLLPAAPTTGVPAELVRRRPDVQRAHALLRAADRDLAAAISARYPRLTLSASVATGSDDASSLFEDWLGTLAGSLLAPLFRGGELRAEVDRAEAVRQQRVLEYGQTMLVAFQEVEDALALEARQRERIASLEAQVALAGQALARLRTEYLNGVADYLDVLTALVSDQRLRRDLLAARLDLLEVRIALYRALAGSITTDREAS